MGSYLPSCKALDPALQHWVSDGECWKRTWGGWRQCWSLDFTHNNHPWPLKFVLRIELHPLFLLILRVLQDILQDVFSCFEMLVVKGFGYFGFCWAPRCSRKYSRANTGGDIYIAAGSVCRGVDLTGHQHTKTICYMSCPSFSASSYSHCVL